MQHPSSITAALAWSHLALGVLVLVGEVTYLAALGYGFAALLCGGAMLAALYAWPGQRGSGVMLAALAFSVHSVFVATMVQQSGMTPPATTIVLRAVLLGLMVHASLRELRAGSEHANPTPPQHSDS